MKIDKGAKGKVVKSEKLGPLHHWVFFNFDFSLKLIIKNDSVF